MPEPQFNRRRRKDVDLRTKARSLSNEERRRTNRTLLGACDGPLGRLASYAARLSGLRRTSRASSSRRVVSAAPGAALRSGCQSRITRLKLRSI